MLLFDLNFHRFLNVARWTVHLLLSETRVRTEDITSYQFHQIEWLLSVAVKFCYLVNFVSFSKHFDPGTPVVQLPFFAGSSRSCGFVHCPSATLSYSCHIYRRKFWTTPNSFWRAGMHQRVQEGKRGNTPEISPWLWINSHVYFVYSV